ncbi:MAG: hypothetical protein A2Z64_15370 [Betaproteobacteria bacterium RIFCSPLOWO2_02_67_12]|nr:MAG: hypothetical protein A2Z64_15370 [Betaproteobacteria bacterium RIFCSPLOWO2_02_67_12]OGA29011.1 MAG: hypothetical protein A3I65_03450 [Betaproteobacteria bacterium RIFCSPLOWO2_02_FULL_68_150]OGA73165.1 MAG: hypothetical protein A3F77_02710 [Betaproteobacteria bacterium RIFCSPLOWO2_12_FULL_67_28]
MSSSAPVPRDSRFLEDMDRQLVGWDDPVARLRRALERNELVAYAQPVMALRGSEPIAFAEVLVRLREEERALLPPGEFLPVFEHFRMMRELDAWIVRRAIDRLARGARLPRLSINISDQTLDDAGFAAFTAAELQRAGVKADALIFELDEKDALARPVVAAQFAVSLKEIGCRMLIDGFGRRSVSFAPLTSLRADYVKVDGVIVRKLGTSDMARSKLNAIVLVGDATGVAIIGESVESQEPLDQLKAAGVGYAQGFGLLPPAPLDDLAS